MTNFLFNMMFGMMMCMRRMCMFMRARFQKLFRVMHRMPSGIA